MKGKEFLPNLRTEIACVLPSYDLNFNPTKQQRKTVFLEITIRSLCLSLSLLQYDISLLVILTLVCARARLLRVIFVNYVHLSAIQFMSIFRYILIYPTNFSSPTTEIVV